MVLLPGIRYPVSDKVQEDTFLLFNCGHYSLDRKEGPENGHCHQQDGKEILWSKKA